MRFSYYLCNIFHLETRPKIRKRGEINEFKGLKIMATKKCSRRSGGRKDEVVISIDVWKSHTNLTHAGKYFRPSKVKITSPTLPK
ncbi:hypothetical protein ABVC62_08590 [Prevotella bivia]|uniref:hypothetical protein n=1 Tax=Prevotella bivia TaxID=28125 RepID=UPI003369E047